MEVSSLITLLFDTRLTVVMCGYSTLHFFSDTYAHGMLVPDGGEQFNITSI